MAHIVFSFCESRLGSVRVAAGMLFFGETAHFHVCYKPLVQLIGYWGDQVTRHPNVRHDHAIPHPRIPKNVTTSRSRAHLALH